MYYVRWKKGENVRGRVFPPLDSDHPSTGTDCLLCDIVLSNGTEVQLLAVGPDPQDEESIEKFEQDRWFNALAVLVHHACAEQCSDVDLIEFFSTLRIGGRE